MENEEFLGCISISLSGQFAGTVGAIIIVPMKRNVNRHIYRSREGK